MLEAWAEMTRIKKIIVFLRLGSLLAVALAAGTRAVADEAGLEARVVLFCESHVGAQVGNGECAALAFQALRFAGAETRAGQDFPSPKDYVWGQQVLLVESGRDGVKLTGDLSAVRPGDIVQYRDTQFIKAHFIHHTSIVKAIDERTLTVYQQNVAGVRLVREGSVHIDKLSQGWIRIYRPVPHH
jgi:hypothetical protein